MKNDKIYMEKEKSPQNENHAKLTLYEFAVMVKEMRFNQRRYFRTRKPATLETCKELEAKVDAVVAKITDTQLKLF